MCVENGVCYLLAIASQMQREREKESFSVTEMTNQHQQRKLIFVPIDLDSCKSGWPLCRSHLHRNLFVFEKVQLQFGLSRLLSIQLSLFLRPSVTLILFPIIFFFVSVLCVAASACLVLFMLWLLFRLSYTIRNVHTSISLEGVFFRSRRIFSTRSYNMHIAYEYTQMPTMRAVGSSIAFTRSIVRPHSFSARF